MNKIILSAAIAAALAGAGGAFAQSAECQQRLADGRSVCDVPNPGGRAAPQNHGTVLGLSRNDNVYLGGLFGLDQRGYRNEGHRNGNDRDRDGVRNSRDRDRDGDGVRNGRDSHPDNPRRQ